jgi:NADPH:quinone reductase-like Zn-dependent oxidoreductase
MDRSTEFIALAFCLAFVAHRLIASLPSSVEAWPAPPSRNMFMKAVAYKEHGSIDNLQLHLDYPQPVLQPHQVLIRVHFSSINPCDFKFLRLSAAIPLFNGIIFPKPKIPGTDVSGVVVEIGAEVVKGSIQIGDRVAAMMPLLRSRWGALAEYAAVDASLVAKVGENTTLQQAAAIPLVGLTVMQGFQQLSKVPEKLLIHAAAGGLGKIALQYAKHIMKVPTVAATTSSSPVALKELGADVVIDYTSQEFDKVLDNYNAVFDSMSWLYHERSLRILNQTDGHYLNILSSDWALDAMSGRERIVPLNCLVSKFLFYSLWRRGMSYHLVTVKPNGAQVQALLDLVDKGILQPVLDQTFPLDDCGEAYALLERGHAKGKIILDHNIM